MVSLWARLEVWVTTVREEHGFDRISADRLPHELPRFEIDDRFYLRTLTKAPVAPAQGGD